ncbi:MAG: serine hydrolase [Calditrichia bacterium]|nr:serine hydrolase [Calditrichia bacterium]
MSKLLYHIYLTLLLSGIILTACNQKNGEGDATMKQANSSELSELEKRLKKYIDNKEALVAVSFQDTDQQFYFGINDTISLHAASTMKVPVMMEVFRQSESGRYSMEDSLTIRNEFRSIIDNSLFSLDIGEDSGDRLYSMIGKKESIRSLVNEMITYSGNLATNLLIDRVEAKNVQMFMESLGAKDIQVLRGVEDLKVYRAGKNNTTTAKDLAIIFQAIYDGKYWSEKSRKDMLDILFDQHLRKKIPAKLPADVKVAHKTGSITKIDHDSGIIYPKEYSPYILVVLTRGFEDHKEAQDCIAGISQIVYEWYIINQ